MKIRYIRDWQNGRTVNGVQGTNCDWRQIMAIDYFGVNKAKNKGNGSNLPGNFWVGQGSFWSFITDEDFNTNLWTSDRPNERKSVTIDLGDIYDIDKLVIARANNPAICKETKTEVSVNGSKWITVFDSSIEGTYVEQQNGREFKLQDDRFNVPNEDSSLGEIISFFDDYSEFNKVQKNVLKNNLIDKGVEVTDSDKMSNLIGKVGKIEVGRRWAEGTLSDFNLRNVGDYQSFKITTNWNFAPSVVILNFDNAYVYTNNKTNKRLSVNSKYAYNSSNDAILLTTPTGVGTGYFLQIYLTIQSNGFTVHVKSNSSEGAIYNPTWEAYE